MPKTKMNCETLKNLIELDLDWFDRTKIQEVDKLLHDLQHQFGNHIQLKDITTGEILNVEELARVRGILSMLANANVVQMSLK